MQSGLDLAAHVCIDSAAHITWLMTKNPNSPLDGGVFNTGRPALVLCSQVRE